jgi:hypothetical protein
VKTQRSFDKAYKQSVRKFLLSLTGAYLVFSFFAIYLASVGKFFNVASFEKNVIETQEIGFNFYVKKGMGFFAILLSSIPLNFSNILDLLVLMHTNFAEWDVDVTPADIDFIQPHATLAFGKVAHMFMSRKALQMDDMQSVKLFHVDGHFYKNQYEIWEKRDRNEDDSVENGARRRNPDWFSGDDDDIELSDINMQGSFDHFDVDQEELSLEYLPNEIKTTQKFYNAECDMIL